tara:strand:+ start:990 stop:1175 length:186 start_codon:yes stop_codon:yes gene_type:complete
MSAEAVAHKAWAKPQTKKALGIEPRAFTYFGVTDGARTHDNQNHNLGLYQLSYSHRASEKL